MRGYLAAHNLNIDCLGKNNKCGNTYQYDNRINKFPDDTLYTQNDSSSRLFDGYITNKNEILACRHVTDSWKEFIAKLSIGDCTNLLNDLRGAFSGYIFDGKELLIFTDQISNKAIYYYINDDKWIISNNVKYIIDVLKHNGIEVKLNENAAKYMLSYGFMLDGSSYVNKVNRLLPGEYLRYSAAKGAEITRYYVIRNNIIDMSEDDAITLLDTSFRQAIKREFDKDIEYGYRHLVDLSGGLDSRMVAWVAHDMGYIDQVNMCYCKAGYMDASIAQDIAKYLGHEYYFKSLDDAKWLLDIDRITDLNNCAALYCGITGGERLLSSINADEFGIEHTGMIGDSIIGTFYYDEAFNYSKPEAGYNRYSDLIKYEYDKDIFERYSTKEFFALGVRGMLGAQSTFIMRQNYVETASAFEDVDFMNALYTVPFKYRNNHHLYLKWIEKCYPKAASFGWEKWNGVKPKESQIPLRMIKTALRLVNRGTRQILGMKISDTMNPIDYWYQNNTDIQSFYEEYFNDVKGLYSIPKELLTDIDTMFNSGNTTEKAMALTVLAMAKKIGVRID